MMRHFLVLLASLFAGAAYADLCDSLRNPVRVDREADLILCGSALPQDIALSSEVDGVVVETVYKQPLSECSWNDRRPGFHLVLKADMPVTGLDLAVRDAADGRKVCDLAVDFPEVDATPPDWVGSMPDSLAREVEVNGYRTRYFESGSGRPLVLVHGGQTGGFNNHARKWEQNFPGLAEHFRVIALDRLGQGATDNLQRAEDYPDYYSLDALHLQAFLDALDVRDAIVVGHSQGGWPATRAALDRPDQVSCLVNLSTVLVPNDFSLMADALKFLRYVAGPVHPADGPTYYSVRRGMQLRFPTGNNITPEKPWRVIEQSTSTKSLEARQYMKVDRRPLNPAHPVFDALRQQAYDDIAAGELQARSLVIAGELDKQVPEGLSVLFNQALLDAGVETEYVVVPLAGHSPHIEFPQRFNTLVRQYCGL